MIRTARSLLLLALLAVLGACGGGAGGSGADADPASLAPASAGLYAEALVRPEGATREGALAAVGKVARTPDPEAKLRELLDKAAKESQGDFSYDRDVKPWLGKRVGIFVGDFAQDDAPALVVAATSEPDKARAAADAALKREGTPARDAEHNGVKYKLGEDGMAVGIVDDFLAVGDEPLFKQAVDVAENDKSLAASEKYERVIGELPEERLGTVFIDLKTFFDAAARQDPSSREQLDQLRGIFKPEQLEPVGVALLADGERIAVDSFASSAGAGALVNQLSLLSGTGSTPLVGEMPGDAWLAYGAPKLGASAKAVFDAFAGALGGAAVTGQIKEATGLDLQQDVFSWIGDVALYVRGTDERSLGGAVVIQATDPVRAKSSVAKLVGVLSQRSPATAPQPAKLDGAELAFTVPAAAAGAPQPFFIAVGKGRVVVALGEAAARDGLEAPSKLADAEGFAAAKDTLEGDAEPAFYVAMPAVIAALESFADVDSDPEWPKVKPYLETIESVVSGGEKDGDRLRSRFAVRLK